MLCPSCAPSTRRTARRARLATACAATGDTAAIADLEQMAGDRIPSVAVAAFEGMRDLVRMHPEARELAGRAHASLLIGIDDTDPAVIATCAEILSDSLLRRPASVVRLVDALGALRSAADLDAKLSVIAALGTLGDQRAIASLQTLLDDVEPLLEERPRRLLRDSQGRIIAGRSVPPARVRRLRLRVPCGPARRGVVGSRRSGNVHRRPVPRIAPFTVMNFLKLAERRRLFDGIAFHRVFRRLSRREATPGGRLGRAGYASGRSSRSVHTARGHRMASSGKDTEGSQFFVTQSPSRTSTGDTPCSAR